MELNFSRSNTLTFRALTSHYEDRILTTFLRRRQNFEKSRKKRFR